MRDSLEMSVDSFDSTEDGGTIILDTIIRQQDDAKFIRILNQVRAGKVTEDSMKMINECSVSNKPRPSDGIIPTKLYCTNRDVDNENIDRLNELPGPPISMKAIDKWRVL